jgi:hypothetical protein
MEEDGYQCGHPAARRSTQDVSHMVEVAYQMGIALKMAQLRPLGVFKA